MSWVIAFWAVFVTVVGVDGNYVIGAVGDRGVVYAVFEGGMGGSEDREGEELEGAEQHLVEDVDLQEFLFGGRDLREMKIPK